MANAFGGWGLIKWLAEHHIIDDEEMVQHVTIEAAHNDAVFIQVRMLASSAMLSEELLPHLQGATVKIVGEDDARPDHPD